MDLNKLICDGYQEGRFVLDRAELFHNVGGGELPSLERVQESVSKALEGREDALAFMQEQEQKGAPFFGQLNWVASPGACAPLDAVSPGGIFTMFAPRKSLSGALVHQDWSPPVFAVTELIRGKFGHAFSQVTPPFPAGTSLTHGLSRWRFDLLQDPTRVDHGVLKDASSSDPLAPSYWNLDGSDRRSFSLQGDFLRGLPRGFSGMDLPAWAMSTLLLDRRINLEEAAAISRVESKDDEDRPEPPRILILDAGSVSVQRDGVPHWAYLEGCFYDGESRLASATHFERHSLPARWSCFID
jgi:hypothetical protein